jgi:hypothetical protein
MVTDIDWRTDGGSGNHMGPYVGGAEDSPKALKVPLSPANTIARVRTWAPIWSLVLH